MINNKQTCGYTIETDIETYNWIKDRKITNKDKENIIFILQNLQARYMKNKSHCIIECNKEIQHKRLIAAMKCYDVALYNIIRDETIKDNETH